MQLQVRECQEQPASHSMPDKARKDYSKGFREIMTWLTLDFRLLASGTVRQ